MERELRPDVLCGLLAEPDRLKVFAAVVLGAEVPSAIVEASRLPQKAVTNALRRLEVGGLLTADDGRFTPVTGAFKDAVRAATPSPDEPLDPDQHRASILRNFVRDGRLIQVPVAASKRRVVLEHIVTVFEPGVRYPEKTVNALLRAWYDDHAALRRYLVDEALLSREDGEYWRIGGYVQT